MNPFLSRRTFIAEGTTGPLRKFGQFKFTLKFHNLLWQNFELGLRVLLSICGVPSQRDV